MGAYVIHALIVCNTEASLDLAFAILDIAPRLLLLTHKGEPFSGEGCLHIVCANRREEHALRMVDLAVYHFTRAETRAFLSTQALGVFFNDPPMCWYGDTPLAYACVFGLKRLVARMLETRLVSLDDRHGEISGLCPLHAVAASGLRGMYDYLTTGLPIELRATRTRTTVPGRLPHVQLEAMSALQITAKVGLRVMHQHIMRRELTTTLWVWGPITQYQISLEGIDSSGCSPSDVMEVIARDDASLVTKKFLLDDFMQGFLFALFGQKWARFGWYVHCTMCLLDAAVVWLTFSLMVATHSETEEVADLHPNAHKCQYLLITLGILLGVEAHLGSLYAANRLHRFKGQSVRSIISRTVAWMRGFYLDMNLIAAAFIWGGVILYMAEDGGGLSGVFSLFTLLADPSASDNVNMSHNSNVETVVGDGARNSHHRRRMLEDVEPQQSLRYTDLTEAERVFAVHDYNVNSALAARWDGVEPLVWLLLALGFFFKVYGFIMKASMSSTSLSILLLSVQQVLAGELFVFMAIFLFFLGVFVIVLVAIYPDHPSRGALPQAPSFINGFTATHDILIAGFTGEPIDFNLHPDFLYPLGGWQQVNLVVFYLIYLLYIFLSLILLLNLLIALLGTTFRRTQDEATLHGRTSFARLMLRNELVAVMLGIGTSAGERTDDGRYVHSFRSKVVDRNGELMSDYKDENVFDPVPDEVIIEPPASSPPTPSRVMKAGARPRKARSGSRTLRDPSPTPLVVRHVAHPVLSPERDVPAVNGDLAA